MKLLLHKLSPIISRIYKRKFSLILFPFYIPIAVVFYFLNFRFISLLYNRIGHLVVEPEIFFKKKQLGLYPDYKVFIYLPINKVANKHYILYLNKLQGITPLITKFQNFIFEPFWLFPFLRLNTRNYAIANNETSEWSRISKLWEGKQPILKVDLSDQIYGKQVLDKLGLGNSWFVCFHVREGGYSPKDEMFHSFRNANIETYITAMNYIISLGGKCIRMGDPSMTKLPQIEGVIDYAHSDFRSDRMDVFLCATCKFFFGTSSGLANLASVFGTPLAITNIAPLNMVLLPNYCDRGIFKIYRSSKNNSLLTFNEIFKNDSSNFRHTIDFINSGIELIDNTDEEILGLCEEMLAVNNNSSFDLELQSKFKNLMNPTHYTFGAIGNIGSKFLEKYKILLN